MKKFLIGAALLVTAIGGSHAFMSQEANCHALYYEQTNLTTVMDAMLNPQTPEAQEHIIADFIRACKATLLTYIKCNGG